MDRHNLLPVSRSPTQIPQNIRASAESRLRYYLMSQSPYKIQYVKEKGHAAGSAVG
jgi:hypothetical protein